MNKKFKASSIGLKATCDKSKDKHFEIELEYLTKFGLTTITLKAFPVKPFSSLIEFWDQSFKFGSVFSEIGDMRAFPAFDHVIDNYFESPEFEQSRKEAGKCN
ncbi:hypothetical protein [Algoriphagus aquimarinus]|uniref:Uncharacterized protein n=1 Tax=Algoriphagus aquimarinus TaxID=237018 RepID=A0A5C7AFL1_9BACT|nr:hypothetical protein [Algoriphagus aquimarinus]TXE07566.1 hypothetical protein ESV85_15335 [Algoriphagus aquimarinus]